MVSFIVLSNYKETLEVYPFRNTRQNPLNREGQMKGGATGIGLHYKLSRVLWEMNYSKLKKKPLYPSLLTSIETQ